jgi:hypothetical protein
MQPCKNRNRTLKIHLTWSNWKQWNYRVRTAYFHGPSRKKSSTDDMQPWKYNSQNTHNMVKWTILQGSHNFTRKNTRVSQGGFKMLYTNYNIFSYHVRWCQVFLKQSPSKKMLLLLKKKS